MSTELSHNATVTANRYDYGQRSARYVRETLAPNDIDPRLIFFRRSTVQAQEAYIEAAKQLMDENPAHRLFWGTALGESRGTSLVILNLASALARSHKVVVVDMNVDRPSLDKMFDGLTGMDFGQLCQAWGTTETTPARISLVGPHLMVLPWGNVDREALDPRVVEAALIRLRDLADIVIVDGPMMMSDAWRSRPKVVGARTILVLNEQDLADQGFETALERMDQSELAGCLMNERGRRGPLLGFSSRSEVKT